MVFGMMDWVGGLGVGGDGVNFRIFGVLVRDLVRFKGLGNYVGLGGFGVE